MLREIANTAERHSLAGEIQNRQSGVEVTTQPKAVVIANADDWGLNALATSRILECVRAGAISSVSAMVFMDDSERAAELARKRRIDSGLHLNLTTRFTASGLPQRLLDHQDRVVAYLRSKRYARALFNPLLARSFDYVAKAQIDEFACLYGHVPGRVDGHHHMHLCANVVTQDLLPRKAIVRRIECFATGEKPAWERWYRRALDRLLAKRYMMPDYFFALLPIEPARIRRLLELARRATVEISLHPDCDEEYEFLLRGGLTGAAEGVAIAKNYSLHCLCAARSEAGFNVPEGTGRPA